MTSQQLDPLYDNTLYRRRHSDVSDGLPIASSSNTASTASKAHSLDQPPPSKKSKAAGTSEERKTSRVKPSKGKNTVTVSTHYNEQDVLPSTDSAIRKYVS